MAIMNRMVLVEIDPGGFRLGGHKNYGYRRLISISFQFWRKYRSI